MDELYGLHSTFDYSILQQQQQQSPPPENMITWPHNNNNNYNNFSSPSVVDRNLVYGSDQLGSGSSGISDAASSMVIASSDEEISSAMRAKIASHPLYPKLLEAYIGCQKVGAPPEITHVFDEITRETDVNRTTTVVSSCFGVDPELDDFMETYCETLVKYRSDLSKPFHEATTFLNNIETQLSNLCNGAISRSNVGEGVAGSSEEDASGGETEEAACSRTTQVDRELKDNLLRKYSGYISSLKNEFSKRKKKGKLPKQSRQILFDWWNLHYKWPYPTEGDKIELAASTGLDQKQINNWFINQRKRHWKPSENMQFTLMDSLYGPFIMND